MSSSTSCGPLLYVIRPLTGLAMALFLSLEVAAVLRRDIPRQQGCLHETDSMLRG